MLIFCARQPIENILGRTAIFVLSGAQEIAMFTKRSNYWTKRGSNATVQTGKSKKTKPGPLMGTKNAGKIPRKEWATWPAREKAS
jgi:hypothetical protein